MNNGKKPEPAQPAHGSARLLSKEEQANLADLCPVCPNCGIQNENLAAVVCPICKAKYV